MDINFWSSNYLINFDMDESMYYRRRYQIEINDCDLVTTKNFDLKLLLK